MKNDAKIKDLLTKVENQREALGEKPRVAWRTNCLFELGGKKHNLNAINNFTILVEALAQMKNYFQSMQDAALSINLSLKEIPPIEFAGYPIEDWEEDFKMRVKLIKWQEKKKQLEATEKKLRELVSEEAKTEMELQDIEKLLS